MRWFDEVKNPNLKNVFAVHGDQEQTDEMVRLLNEHGAVNAVAPVPGQHFTLIP